MEGVRKRAGRVPGERAGGGPVGEFGGGGGGSE